MNWQAAIRINQKALLEMLAALCAMMTDAPTNAALPAHIRKAVLRVLQPAESAARRLIVIAATLLHKDMPHKDSTKAKTALPDFASFAKTARPAPFKLFDPRKRFMMERFQAKREPVRRPETRPKNMPRISVIGVTRFAAPVQAEKPVTSASLLGRITALQSALENLPKQARRLARRLQRRKAVKHGPCSVGPIRPGLAPGHRKRGNHPVDAVLTECHMLALDALEAPA